jgi:C4-dicarboxylate-binding protein DctP
MCQLINVYTDGKIRVDFYPNNLLGSHDETFHAVQEGSVEMAVLCPYANLVPGGVINSMPFSVSTWDESGLAYAPDSPLAQSIEAAWNEVGFHTFWTIPLGVLGISNDVRPLKTPADFKNIKFRVSGSVQAVRAVENMAKGTGLTSQTIPWADVYNALERGVVDGCWNSYNSLIEYRHNEVVRYFTDVNFLWDCGQVVINKEVWDNLTPDLQNAIAKAGKIAELVRYETGRREEGALKKQAIELGVEIYELTPQERAVFMENANVPAIWEELATPWLDKQFPGQDMTKQILDRIAQIKAE